MTITIAQADGTRTTVDAATQPWCVDIFAAPLGQAAVKIYAERQMLREGGGDEVAIACDEATARRIVAEHNAALSA